MQLRETRSCWTTTWKSSARDNGNVVDYNVSVLKNSYGGYATSTQVALFSSWFHGDPPADLHLHMRFGQALTLFKKYFLRRVGFPICNPGSPQCLL